MKKSPSKKADRTFAEREFADAETHRAAARAEVGRLLHTPLTNPVQARWMAAAAAIEPEAVAYEGPWAVLLDEAYDVVRFVVSRWHPRSPPGFAAKRPGLRAVQARLPFELAEEIVTLARMADAAQNEVQMVLDGGEGGRRGEALTLLQDVVRAMAFYCDDDTTDANDAVLAQLQAAYDLNDPPQATLAEALSAFGAFAQRNRAGLAEIAFDVSRLDGIPALVEALRAQPDGATRLQARQDVLAPLRLRRDRLATLLYARMGRVRRAAAYCFAKHPGVVREVTSAYQRDRRKAARQRAKAKKGEG